jgi:hypothetical protein
VTRPQPPGPDLRTHGPAVERDLMLALEGWRRRFVGASPRLDEMIELYRELGHDVRVEELTEHDLAAGCAGCRVALSFFRIVYTRLNT